MKRGNELFLSPPELCNTETLLSTPGVCYYIPIYQRDLIWGKEDVQRFFDGIVQGIKDLSSPSKAKVVIAETFMGTIICLDDGPYYASISPQVDNDLPAKVYILIDGQQRISVSLILATVLHEYLSTKILGLIAKKDADEQGKRLLKLKKETEDNLFDMLASGARMHGRRYYPRIIESQRDCWSTKKELSKYYSPISALLFNYIEHVNNKGMEEFVLKKLDNDPSNKLHLVRSIHSNMKCYVASLTQGKDDSDYSSGSLPKNAELFREPVYKGLLECSNSIDFKSLKQRIKVVSGTEKDKPEVTLESIVRIVTFASYFLKRIRYIRMVTTSEHLAINIFDSLNTTGVPLTALETLIPKVGKTYMSLNKKFEDSDSWKMFKQIKKHISFFKQEEQAVKTKDLVVSFALSESGEKLSTSLGLQRSYMLGQYERHNKGENPERNVEEFIANLLHVTRVRMAFAGCKTDFVKCLEEGATASKHIQLAKEASFCLEFLAASNHRITIPIITRFYSEYLRPKRKKVADHKALCRAICASAAFFALWRFPKESTSNIDQHHRDIMGTHARRPKAGASPKAPDITCLQKEYCRYLGEISKISTGNKLSKDKWKTDSTSRQIYKTQKQVTRFILLLSAYSGSRGSRKIPGSGNFDSVLWSHESHNTIEHILPQNSPDNGKKAENDEESEILHRIGNLTLLPSKINSYIGNIEWSQRRLIYAVLSAKDEQTFNDQVKKLLNPEHKVPIRRSWDVINKFHKVGYLPAIEGIADYEKFGSDQIKQRGEEILDSAWDMLTTWLGTE